MTDEELPDFSKVDWLNEAGLQILLDVLSKSGDSAKVVGGAVRNAILDKPVKDIDVATVFQPDEVMERCSQAGLKCVPTGISHGTVTIVLDGSAPNSIRRVVEVTTLRHDVETDGRHALVSFGSDWEMDAARRDFTMNALYVDKDGVFFDPIGGLEDCKAGLVRFIGSAEARIEEDYLRILRFFRFFAFFGVGRPDAEGLKACARLKQGIEALSAERVWSELKLLFGAPDPTRAILWMRNAGVLSVALPENGQYGVDMVPIISVAEKEFGWKPDYFRRLMALIPRDVDRISQLISRLKMSNAEAGRLRCWTGAPMPGEGDSDDLVARMLYRVVGDVQGVADQLEQEIIRRKTYDGDEAKNIIDSRLHQLTYSLNWVRPKFPIAGKDLKAFGFDEGEVLGQRLKALEDQWVEADFTLSKADLLVDL